jgi:hypothetical protein
MSLLQNILNDLRTKRLWPVVIGLIAGIVAVPVLLSKTAKSESAPIAQNGSSPGVADTPAISVSNALPHTKLTGHAHDPFIQNVPTTTAPTSAPGGTSTAGSGASGLTVPGSTSASTSPTGGTATPTSPSTSPGTTTTTTTTTTTSTPTETPPELTATQVYNVSFSITNQSGGFNTIDPVQRLSVLPSGKQRQMVELGVLQGGKRVLFAVEPGTVLSGPGTCTPGPLDCEILSLAEGQNEDVAKKVSGGVVPIGTFAVTGITKANYASVAAANEARRKESEAGRDLLATSTLSAVSLFEYKPNLGVVVDLRNLTVGGS